MKKWLVLLGIVLLSTCAFAEEIRQEAMPQYAGMVAHYGVDSGKLYLAYSLSDLRAIFGEDSLIEVDRAGFLKIKYMQGGQLRDFGTLSGLIIADTSTNALEITNGVYNTPTTNSNAFQIRGKEFKIDASTPSSAKIKITNGAYLQGNENTFFGCTSGANINCEMIAVSMPTTSYLNITGWGFITKGDTNLNTYLNEGFQKMKTAISECMSSNSEECNMATPILNMRQINVLSGEKLSFETSLYNSEGQFGDFKLKSGARVKISDMTDSMGPWIFEGANLIVKMPLATAGLKSKAAGAYANAILEDVGNSLVAVVSGKAIITGDEPTYDKCVANRAPYNDIACIYFDNFYGILKIKPRAKDAPLWLSIQIQDNYKNLFIEPFDTELSAAQHSFVEIRKQSTSTTLKFYANDIIPSGGNWFDLGMSFVAYLFPKDAVATGQESLEFYDKFECKNPETTKDCWLNGGQVQGFTSSRRNYRCASDSDCGAGRKCSEKLCVKQAQCKELEEYNRESEAITYNLAFISDEYDSEIEFKNEIKAFMEGNGGFKGLLDASPFAENQAKFKYYMLDGGRMPLQSEGIPSIDYYISLRGLCFGLDEGIIITKKDINSNAYAISHEDLSSAGAGKSMTIVHEMGHFFGGLKDEYWTPGNNVDPGVPNCLPYDCNGREGCIDAKTYWGIELANKAKNSGWTGCGGNCGNPCKNLLRPRLNSIMRHQWENEGSTPDGRGDTFSEPALKQLNERIACIGVCTSDNSEEYARCVQERC